MKYMLILADNEGDLAELQKDEAAFQAYMAPWMEYTQNMQEAGVMVSGEPLEESSKATCVRVRDGKRLVEDGPFVDSKEQLGGFYIIDVDNLDGAIKWAERCPAAKTGVVEVRPLWNIPG